MSSRKQEILEYMEKVSQMADLLGLAVMVTVVDKTKEGDIETGSLLRGRIAKKNMRILLAANSRMQSEVQTEMLKQDA